MSTEVAPILMLVLDMLTIKIINVEYVWLASFPALPRPAREKKASPSIPEEQTNVQ